MRPVRAGIVPAKETTTYRWSSLPQFVKGPRPPELTARELLTHSGLPDTAERWSRYVSYLVELAGDSTEQQKQGFDQMSHGWAIGTHGWRKALAKEQTHLALATRITSDELRDIKEAAWQRALDAALLASARTQADVDREPQKARWKIKIAAQLRRQSAASYRWIAAALNMGNHDSLRVYVSHQRD
jgi:hypothetical protein